MLLGSDLVYVPLVSSYISTRGRQNAQFVSRGSELCRFRTSNGIEGMGKHGKVTKAQRSYSKYSSSNYLISPTEGATALEDEVSQQNGESDQDHDAETGVIMGRGPAAGEEPVLNKHALYQRAVQKPKGDISYLQKFFLSYVGGRTPLHLREDFCGTALICAEWVRGDTRRTAVGLDLDEEALTWGLQHNVVNAGSDAYDRVNLFCGDVINPISKAHLKQADPKAFSRLSNVVVTHKDGPEKRDVEQEAAEILEEESGAENSTGSAQDIPAADMICAFNYSCCCLQKRSDLVRYFKEALKAISAEGGIFAMDLYGGASSECALKLRRRFDDFQYTWEQEDFDVITRTTNISLHFRLKKNQGVLRHAFSYHWRLWTLPEVRECLEEVGFQSVHFWIREMPDLQGRGHEESEVSDMKANYEEVHSFSQEDAWNAYVVAVAPPRSRATREC